MAKIAIIMGSESDREVVNEALPFLNYFKIEANIQVMSAHRTPHQVQTFAESAEDAGYQVIIACAGMAAHLPGVVAAYTALPVIGVPLSAGALNGVDSLYSIVQMPAGVPVAAMAIGKPGMKNAAIFAAQIIARSDKQVAALIKKFKQNQCRIAE
ncbi:MAG: 5-(carboxyamino)imidazole ribonucleotide mutase [Caldithrix sp. RBG_13_44_9]|nr:MAG: 5-(carboxyamino)imidazole ribonucleotide mutase [Caldithrix sp. RBG_13_44_9]